MIIRRTLDLMAPMGIIAALLIFACGQAKDSATFAAKAAQGGIAEVEMGRLAAQRASDPSVKAFGERMVADHSKANMELKAVAARKGTELPSDMSTEQKSDMDKLSKLSGADFDKEYMSLMVKDHEEDVKEFETQSKYGNDADIKSFAAKTLPTLEQHLKMARAAAQQAAAKY